MTTEFTAMDYLLGISTFVLTGLLSWGGYYLKKFVSSVESLKTAVEKIGVLLAVEQVKADNLKETFTSSVTNLDTKITIIGNKVDQHEKDITILKTLHRDDKI